MIVTNAVAAKERLEGIIQSNLGSTAAVVERVMSEVPRDVVVPSSKLQYEVLGVSPVTPTGRHAVPVERSVALQLHDERLTLHPHALQQVGEKAGIPRPYVERLLAGAPWQTEILEHALNSTFRNLPDRNLVRAVGSQARAVLSDKYKRLDSRQIIDTFVGEVQRGGAQPYSAHSNDVRVSIKAIVPVVHTVALQKGGADFLAFGIEASNSDYGAGAFSIRSFFLRLVCLNGMTAEDAMRQVHLGRRLDDNVLFSERTYKLDTDATVSAMRDVVRGQLGVGRIDALVDRIRQADGEEVDWARMKGRLTQVLGKDELRRVDESFRGEDVVNLPPGNTAWRAANAISWLANGKDMASDRRLELEKLSGAVLTGKVAVDQAA